MLKNFITNCKGNVFITKRDNVVSTFKNILTVNVKIINNFKKIKLADKMSLEIEITSVFYIKKTLRFKICKKIYLFNLVLNKYQNINT